MTCNLQTVFLLVVLLVLVDSVIDTYKKVCPKIVECTKKMKHDSKSKYVKVYSTRYGLHFMCDTETDGGGWIVIQRRLTQTTNFNRNWTEYKEGFGSLNGDYWLGNEYISKIVLSDWYELRIDMVYNSTPYYALYKDVYVSEEGLRYSSKLRKYTGNAGDVFGPDDYIEFSTPDRDLDGSENQNLAEKYKSGWWFKDTIIANLNGDFQKGEVFWSPLTGNSSSLSSVEMKVRKYGRDYDFWAGGWGKTATGPDNSTLDSCENICPKFEECTQGMKYRRKYVKVYSTKYALQFQCDTKTEGGGWIVIHRRAGNGTNLNRDWKDYKHAFGSLCGNYWIGINNLDKILSTQGIFELRIDMVYNRKNYYAHYGDFSLSGQILENVPFLHKFKVNTANRNTKVDGGDIFWHALIGDNSSLTSVEMKIRRDETVPIAPWEEETF